ncbi:ABC transporter permease [Streptomyces sp. NPDC051320]|uniref:ABC transporter permease n=1 Tax=Streptomyces sp. NPDC051320 TaxID=3154644 RepID=UPI003419B87A
MSHTTHLAGLGRAELTLFLRSKANLVSALLVPLMLVFTMKVILDQFDLSGAGLTMGPVMISSAAGIILLMGLYAPLTSIYVMRREQLILKRLRSGEVGDLTILLGAAVPVVAAVPVQFLIISAGITVVAGTGAPAAPLLAVIGIVLGTALITALAALTTVLARTAETAQIAVLPGMFLLPLTSGTYVPLEILPHGVQEVLRFFPLTPVTDLVRSGWTGSLSVADAAVRTATLLVWIALTAWAVRRSFRWEPRT